MIFLLVLAIVILIGISYFGVLLTSNRPLIGFHREDKEAKRLKSQRDLEASIHRLEEQVGIKHLDD